MWVRIDDHAPMHPKLVRAGAEAGWLWLSGLCYSNAHQLDGRLDRDLIPALYPPLATKSKQLSARLVRVGLWHEHPNHYEIHDYDKYQAEALKAQVEDTRRYERERKAAQRAAKRAAVPKPVPAPVPAGHHPVSPAPGRSGRPVPAADQDLKRVEDLDPPDPRARANGTDSRLDPDSDRKAERATALLESFERIVHAGKRIGDRDRCLKLLGELLPAVDDRAPDAPEAFFERVLTAYNADRRSRSKTPTVELFSRDFAQWAQTELDRMAAPTTRSASIAELRAVLAAARARLRAEHSDAARYAEVQAENALNARGVFDLDDRTAVIAEAE